MGFRGNGHGAWIVWTPTVSLFTSYDSFIQEQYIIQEENQNGGVQRSLRSSEAAVGHVTTSPI